jgi:soluble lytic murein transglycosylase-like protein
MRNLLIITLVLLITTTVAYGGINIDRTCSLEEIYNPLIDKICEKYGEDPNLVKAIIRVESMYNHKAISKNRSCKGLMQLSGATARKFGVIDVFDPEDNIEGGVRYLRHLRSIFGDDLFKVVASYNVGEGSVYKKKIPSAGKKYADMIMLCKLQYDKRDGLV